MYPKQITDALQKVLYPGNGKSLAENGMLSDDIRINSEDNTVEFSITFPRLPDPFMNSVVRSAEATIKALVDPEAKVKIDVKALQQAPEKPKDRPLLPGVKNIIGIASGKGGVGKSTVAANLAVALARKGYKVGLLDADIFGPSVPKMFGVEDETVYIHKVDDRDLIIPIKKYGVELLSIGFLVDPAKAVMWRGSMASNALNQLIGDADWGKLDYFLIDMPPGTSDIHLTLVQTLAMTGAIIVTTPQAVATADAVKGIAMFKLDAINVPLLGLIENMAWFTPEAHPDEKYYIFGRDGGKKLAKEAGTELLGQIPLVVGISESGDRGEPIAMQDSITGDAFMHVAEKVVKALEHRNATLPPTQKVKMRK